MCDRQRQIDMLRAPAPSCSENVRTSTSGVYVWVRTGKCLLHGRPTRQLRHRPCLQRTSAATQGTRIKTQNQHTVSDVHHSPTEFPQTRVDSVQRSGNHSHDTYLFQQTQNFGGGFEPQCSKEICCLSIYREQQSFTKRSKRSIRSPRGHVFPTSVVCIWHLLSTAMPT